MTNARKASAAQQRAVVAFADAIQDVVGCVLPDRVSYRGGTFPAEASHLLTYNDAVAQPLKGPLPLYLSVSLRYQIIQDDSAGWRIVTTKYVYEVEDGSGGRILAYHWHPGGESRVTTPHIHIGSVLRLADGTIDVFRRLTKAHLPSSRVALEQVVRFLVDDLGVEPRRSDWTQILDHRQREYEAQRSWT